MKKIVTIVGVFCCLGLGAAFSADSFEQIKKAMAEAGCNRFEFLSVVESDIFDTVDSTAGVACIARDGRYSVTIGTDQYLYDGEYLYSFSGINNQVTVERVDPRTVAGEEISFVTRLDEFFSTSQTSVPGQYRLVKTAGDAENLPDSMLVTITTEPLGLSRIEYYDLNDELNRIIFLSQRTDAECDSTRFLPVFPDSAEVIKLY